MKAAIEERKQVEKVFAKGFCEFLSVEFRGSFGCCLAVLRSVSLSALPPFLLPLCLSVVSSHSPSCPWLLPFPSFIQLSLRHCLVIYQLPVTIESISCTPTFCSLVIIFIFKRETLEQAPRRLSAGVSYARRVFISPSHHCIIIVNGIWGFNYRPSVSSANTKIPLPAFCALWRPLPSLLRKRLHKFESVTHDAIFS